MKVLFIDDEPLIRQGLKSIIPWNDLGFDDFYEAEDGSKGLEIINKEQPDLVILDICMENRSGLSTAKEARLNDFTGRIIILSGYSDFKYAKEAIDYDVSAYLLKPVDPDELIEAVKKALDELHRENVLSIYYSQPAVLHKNYVLLQIITGKLALTPEVAEAYDIPSHSTYYRLISLYFLDSTTAVTLCDSLKQLKRSFVFASSSDTEHILLLSHSSQFASFRTQFHELTEQSKELAKSLLVICSSIEKKPTALPQMYQENCMIYHNLYYYKTSSNLLDVLTLKSTIHNFSTTDLNMLSLINDLARNILQLNYTDVKESLHTLYMYFTQTTTPKDTIGFMLSNCYSHVLQTLLSHYALLEFDLPSLNEFTGHFCTDQYLYESMEYLLKQFNKAINFIKSNAKQNPCEQICQYIEANASEPLKLESIAELFGYNSAYLGKLFYKEIGVHFNTYLDQIRIKHAKTYLKKGSSIAQACEKSGFTNTDYFTKKFKKYVGMLPSEYKKYPL